jgi:uroporphyrinogen decarboxylase
MKPLPIWPGTLTSRQRFLRQLNGEPVDRSVNREFGYWDEVYDSWNLFLKHDLTSEGKANRFFGFDPFHRVAASHPETGNYLWLNPPFKRTVIESKDGVDIIRNEEGLLAEVSTRKPDVIPHFLSSSIQTPEDWKIIKEERLNVNHPSRNIPMEYIKQQQEWYPDDHEYPLGIYVGSLIGKVRDLLTFEGLSYAWFDYPEMVEDMVETCCQLIEKYLDQMLPHFSIDYAMGWEDISFNSGPLITIDLWERIVVPRYQRISKKLREHGVDIYIVDTDGRIDQIVPGFLEGGVNVMFPYEVKPNMFVGDFLQKFPEIKVMGGIDKFALIKGRDAIDSYLESILPYVKQGRFIPHVDHRCPPNVKEDDYLYYLEKKKELFGGFDK